MQNLNLKFPLMHKGRKREDTDRPKRKQRGGHIWADTRQFDAEENQINR